MPASPRVFSALLCSACVFDHAIAAEAGDRVTGRVEVTVTVTGFAAAEDKSFEFHEVAFSREARYESRLAGMYAAGSTFKEVDDRPATDADPGARNVQTLEAAIEDCGDDETCIMNAAMAMAPAEGESETDAFMPNLARYIVLSATENGSPVGCGPAQIKVSDHHTGKSMVANVGLVPIDHYMKADKRLPANDPTLMGNDSFCDFFAAIDTTGGTYHVSIPVSDMRAEAVRSGDGVTEIEAMQMAGHHDDKARFIDLPATHSQKIFTGEHTVTDMDSYRSATFHWKITLD